VRSRRLTWRWRITWNRRLTWIRRLPRRMAVRRRRV
jgi:hypothetical protein